MSKGKSRKRVRLKDSEPDQRLKKMAKARDESYRKAPRNAKGKIVQGYAYKATLEGYRENGLEPTVLDGVTPGAIQKPLFVRDPRIEKKLVKYIREGHHYTTVCRVIGITVTTFKDWLEKGKAGVTEDYARLFRRVAKAEAKAEMRQLKQLRIHEKADWRVSAWQLERRWPENWSKQDRVTAEMKLSADININTKEQLGNSVLTDETARELARKMIDGNEFGYEALENA